MWHSRPCRPRPRPRDDGRVEIFLPSSRSSQTSVRASNVCDDLREMSRSAILLVDFRAAQAKNREEKSGELKCQVLTVKREKFHCRRFELRENLASHKNGLISQQRRAILRQFSEKNPRPRFYNENVHENSFFQRRGIENQFSDLQHNAALVNCFHSVFLTLIEIYSRFGCRGPVLGLYFVV